MSPLRTRWTLAVLLGSVALLSVISIVTSRQRGGQEWFAQLPPGQCYANKPPDCAPSCPNGVEMDLGNSCYCSGPCTDLSGNPGQCGAGTCAASVGGSCGNGAVDPGEECDGGQCCTFPDCKRRPAGTACTPPNGRCNSNGECIVGSCGNGIREGAEQCDEGAGANGSIGSCCNENCTFEPLIKICRQAVGGLCDAADHCTGSSGACPADAFRPLGEECRAAAGVCDAPEACTGNAPACPPNNYMPTGTVCRSVAGACDVAEACSGTGPACPADVLATSAQVCRTAADVCDLAEKCTGNTVTCPADSKKSNGTACPDDGVVCTEDKCNGIDNDCKHQAGINCPVSSASSSASSFSSTSSVAPPSSPTSSAASSVPSSAASSVLSSSLPPPSSPASSASSIAARCCFPSTGCTDKWTGVCAKLYGTEQECQVKCKAGSSVSSSSVISSASSAQSSDGNKRFLVTCDGMTPFLAEKLSELLATDKSTAVSNQPADGGKAIRQSILPCSAGVHDAASVPAFCLRKDTCTFVQSANDCSPDSAFSDLQDCETIAKSGQL